MKKNTGIKLYKLAKNIIPGGTQLLSKRPEMFHTKIWPSYYVKSKGIKIWDMDNVCYKDFSIMSVGQCPLGYSNAIVNKKIISAIMNGSTSTLNSYEEVELAKKLCEMHPGMSMARFAKTGGEANTIAIRIARAYNNRSKIIASGYFGWHDWYIAANLNDKKSLNTLLLKGLSPIGVPKELSGTTLALNYGDTKKLEEYFKKNKNQIAAVILEVQKSNKLNLKFIKEARRLCKKNNSVLIFDEITSGFRINLGGIYLRYNIKPDIVTFGKALGNGYPISAVIGKKHIMQSAQKTFISSSYWTDRIGYVAANATIKEFKKKQIHKYLINLGKYFKKEFEKIIYDLDLKISIDGLTSVPRINFNYGKDSQAIKTLFTQQMLKNKFLASNLVYLSSSHSKRDIDEYMKNVRKIFTEMSKIGLKKFKSLLNGRVSHKGFERLN